MTLLCWLEREVRENLGYFQRACRYFNVSFHATACPPLAFTKQTGCSTILHKMQSTSLDKIINIKPCIGLICSMQDLIFNILFLCVNMQEYVWFWWNKYRLPKTDRETKTSLLQMHKQWTLIDICNFML